jgi:hypothetical protein
MLWAQVVGLLTSLGDGFAVDMVLTKCPFVGALLELLMAACMSWADFPKLLL